MRKSEGQNSNNSEMNEKRFDEVIHRIEAESEQVPIPDSLTPENMKKHLVQKKRKSMRYFAEIAAAVVLVVALGGAGVYRMIGKNTNAQFQMKATESADTNQNTKESLIGDVSHMSKIGNYRVAKSYEEFYKLVDENRELLEYDKNISMDIGGSKDASVEDQAYSDTTKESLQTTKTDDYSKTNTMFEGIDESDFVKNDFNNLFVQDDNKVSVIDISGEKMKLITAIKPDLEESDRIREMYVDTNTNRLVLIIERIIEKELKDGVTYTGSDVYEGCINIYEDASVIMQTYDITDRTKPELIGKLTVDGRYKDSRKNDQQVVLFTTRYLSSIDPESKDGLIPTVNEKKMNLDSIYIGDSIETELAIVSVNLSNPGEAMDQITIMSGYPEIYVSDNAIYLYEDTYKDGEGYTDITRFYFHTGYLGQGQSITVRGSITDKFAISEGEEGIRVLTTIDESDGSTNELHLYNFGFEEESSVTGIAKGEEIYAARYIGNIAYFVTYHNTDPLYAVDISDPNNPKILGNVKMTGYSDYLHPYGDNLLLGIGYETNPDTSENLGVKLTMFDISDPVNLKVLDSVVIDRAITEATHDYKTILADAKKNLIGLSVEENDEKHENSSREYLVYRWQNGHFVNVLKQDLGDDVMGKMLEKTRGVYAGMRFYCISQNAKSYKVISYDMEDNFKKLDTLKL